MRRSVPVLWMLLMLAGCVSTPKTPAPVAIAPRVAEYRLACPDVLQVAFLDRPAWDCTASIDVDGGLPLGRPGKPFVAGQTLQEATESIALTTGFAPERVQLSVQAARSQRVYLSGPERQQRFELSYLGPESVGSLLARSGRVPLHEVHLRDVWIVRANTAVGGPSVILQVTDTSIVEVQPADQIYLGSTRWAAFEWFISPKLRPLYDRLFVSRESSRLRKN
ncbi:MAG: hypothetical protein ACRCZF_03385 [Gemmataceae bacterium]